jgi:LmbE family N-acetylglucosaminyl deacetylase
MLASEFSVNKGRGLRLLCLGAHSDDIEIGCGGTIMRLLREYRGSTVFWVVLSADDRRRAEAEKSALQVLKSAARTNIRVMSFKESYFPFAGDPIKSFFESLKKEVKPDIIFSHYRRDLHQDHRLVSDLTWNTFRDHLILEYEIMKYDGDLGMPNYFVPLDRRTARHKVAHILRSFPSQSAHPWFSEDAFLALLRLRGIEANAPERYAEAFYCRKIVI